MNGYEILYSAVYDCWSVLKNGKECGRFSRWIYARIYTLNH